MLASCSHRHELESRTKSEKWAWPGFRVAKQVFGFSISDFSEGWQYALAVNLDKNRQVLDKSSEFSKLINKNFVGRS